MIEGLSRDFSEPLNPREFTDTLAHLSLDQRNTFWKIYSANQNSLTRDEATQRRILIDLLRDASKDIEQHAARTFSDLGVENWDLQTMRRMGRDRVLFEQIRQRLQALNSNLNSHVEQAMLSHYKKSYYRQAYKMDSITPPDVGIRFDIMPDHEIIAMLHRPFEGAMFSDRLGLITDEMAGNIHSELTRSMIDGESWNQAARRIRGEMGTRGRKAMYRSEIIARTEIARAQEMGSQQFNRDNDDIIDKVVWVAHAGACDDCRAMNGTVLEDPEDYPPEASHPNCTCCSQAIPKRNGKEVIELPAPKGFDNWMEEKVGGTI